SYGSTDLLPLVVDAISDARAADQGAPGQDARHRWRLELPAEPVTVRADPDRFQQVLVNLLANARTHTPPGTTVTVSVRPPVRAGGRVALEVRDDGPGIPAELLPHVFERFARGDASRSRGAGTGTATGSTGLGLAIVQAVVSAHGGSVRVDSEPGRTVFVIELPAEADEARHAGPAGADEARHAGSAGAEAARHADSAGADEALRADSAGAGAARRADSQGRDRLSTPV
ncbi:sensor histidine kinase, partial [Streptomyces anulatus]